MFSQFSFPGVTVSDTAYLRDTMRNSDATLRQLRHHVHCFHNIQRSFLVLTSTFLISAV